MNVYAYFTQSDLTQVAEIVQFLYPENNHEWIEQGEVFLSDGDLFECSVEKSIGTHIALSGEIHLELNEAIELLHVFVDELKKRKLIYSLEYEYHDGDVWREIKYL